jgi:hypothetical protein
VQALGKLSAQSAIEAVSALLTDPAGQVRVAAVEALAELRSPHALDVLTVAAADDDVDLRRAALLGLGVMKDPAALPALIAASAAPDAATRMVALSALHALETPEALDALARALQDSDEGVSTAAIGLLATWPHATATAHLIEALRAATAPNHISRMLATPAPGRIAGLLTALVSADDELAPLLISALGRLDPDDGLGTIFEALRMPNPAARKAAAAMLAARGTREALRALTLQATEDPEDEVRRLCALLLAQ